MAKKPVDRSVESLKTLLDQINKSAPKRSKASDGWIGDKAHMSRHSDHNPEPDGTVDARDFTHDPSGGADMRVIATAIVTSKEPRLSYIIFEGKIIHGRKGSKGKKPWVWYKYAGPNGHYHHMHVSVLDDGQDNTTPWQIGKGAAPSVKPVASKPTIPKAEQALGFPAHYKDGKVHEELRAVQLKLDTLGYPEVGTVDGQWGDKTATAVMAFRLNAGLPTKPDIDKDFVAALAVAAPRKIATERANATMADLRKEGVEEVKDADQTQLVGTVITAGGAAVGGGSFLDKAEETGGIIGRIAGILEPIQGFIADNIWLIAIAGGGFIIWKSGVLKGLRLVKHQNAQDVSR